ncbi:hypothetical protein ACFFOW_13610 [Curtobacterium albidum]|nr:hypothetical protein [Curtobacterium albidum]
MSQPRRPRGSMVDPVIPGWKIERASRDLIASMAASAGVSASVFLELMAEHTKSELTTQGIPSWMPEKDRTGELPIDGP